MCVHTHASADLHMAVFSSGKGILNTDNYAKLQIDCYFDK